MAFGFKSRQSGIVIPVLSPASPIVIRVPAPRMGVLSRLVLRVIDGPMMLNQVRVCDSQAVVVGPLTATGARGYKWGLGVTGVVADDHIAIPIFNPTPTPTAVLSWLDQVGYRYFNDSSTAFDARGLLIHVEHNNLGGTLSVILGGEDSD